MCANFFWCLQTLVIEQKKKIFKLKHHDHNTLDTSKIALQKKPRLETFN